MDDIIRGPVVLVDVPLHTQLIVYVHLRTGQILVCCIRCMIVHRVLGESPPAEPRIHYVARSVVGRCCKLKELNVSEQTIKYSSDVGLHVAFAGMAVGLAVSVGATAAGKGDFAVGAQGILAHNVHSAFHHDPGVSD